MSNELPKCPGCGQVMSPDSSMELGDRSWDSTMHYVRFECKCGWQSPEKYASTFKDAFAKAMDAANMRKEADRAE